MFLRQSTARTIQVGPFVATNGYTHANGLTLLRWGNVLLFKNGTSGLLNDGVGSLTSTGNGMYALTLEAEDVDTAGTLKIEVYDDGNTRPLAFDYQVVEENVYDALFADGADAGTNLALLAAPVSPSFLKVPAVYTLRVNRDGGIVSPTSREILAGEIVTVQFDFTDILGGEIFTSVSAPTSDNANVTIDSYGVNGLGDGGKGINVVMDCSSASAGENVTIEVAASASGRTRKASHLFKIK